MTLESASDNPFLPRFYQEPKRYALPTQLHFLFERSRQLRDLAQGDLFRTATVSDFLIDKDMLFARLNLDDDEFDLYKKVYADLAPQAATPDLVIYLQAPVNVLDELYINAMRNLHVNGKDPLEVIAWRDVYAFLEYCADCCENVADVVDSIVMKNS